MGNEYLFLLNLENKHELLLLTVRLVNKNIYIQELEQTLAKDRNASSIGR